MPFIRLLAAVAFIVFCGATGAQAGATFDEIKQRGFIRCGVGENHIGFTYIDDKTKFAGFDVDYCKALAAAVFGDTERVQYLPLNNVVRFSALQNKEIDVLIRTTTWTLTRDASLGLTFAGVTLYDGQGVMARKDLGATDLNEIKKATVCAAKNTTSIKNIVDYLKARNIDHEVISYFSQDGVVRAFFTHRCDLFTDDSSALASIRAVQSTSPEDYVIFPRLLSKEPLGPAVRDDDMDWFKVVRWVVFATMEAEELGLNSGNIDAAKQSEDPTIRRFVGTEDKFGEYLGLPADWAYNVVAEVGNYKEIFARNIGPGTVVNLPRGVNKLWKDGGLLYPMPFR